ncbi:MAG: hypothetical protein CR217_11960 [Beijerinckiaceae bacterium]|nr:MAG: hypothetical protein CR217_11960 [Beijerinckiaceae bacterium]
MTTHAAVTARSADCNGNAAATTTAKAVNGVAQAKTKLASPQAIVNNAKQNKWGIARLDRLEPNGRGGPVRQDIESHG